MGTMTTTDKKRYNKMETVLQYINKNFVTVSDEDAKKTNPILQQVISTITDAMKSVSPLFSNLFESFLFGGSYYDGLKVGKPDEFDLDLRLVLPKLVDAKLAISNQPGFVTVAMPGWNKFEASSEFAKYKELAKFKDSENYLVQDKVLQWMEGVVNLALNKIGKVGNLAEIPINGKKAYVALKKSGPALTALITYDNVKLDVDFVAVFKMTSEQWPPSPFKPLPTECNGKKEFLIVPKPPKSDVGKKERYWRLSFQEQERVLIMGNNTCKPALRLLKKLRDTQNHNMISSYFIKTVFLHEIEKQDKAFWNSSLSFIFMHMLKTYRDYLATYKIPYYWNKNNNMLQYINKITIDNFKNYLTRVIDSVDKKVDEYPYIIGEYLATPEEQAVLKNVNFCFGKKVTKVEDITSGDDSSLTECPSRVDDTVAMLSQCSLDVVEVTNISTSQADNKSNLEIIRLLRNIELRISTMHTDTAHVLQKFTALEHTVDELKHDTSCIKDQLRNLGVKDIPETVQNKSDDNKELLEQSNNIKFMLEKIDYLDKTVQDLKSENDVLKTGLRHFVMSD